MLESNIINKFPQLSEELWERIPNIKNRDYVKLLPSDIHGKICVLKNKFDDSFCLILRSDIENGGNGECREYEEWCRIYTFSKSQYVYTHIYPYPLYKGSFTTIGVKINDIISNFDNIESFSKQRLWLPLKKFLHSV